MNTCKVCSSNIERYCLSNRDVANVKIFLQSRFISVVNKSPNCFLSLISFVLLSICLYVCVCIVLGVYLSDDVIAFQVYDGSVVPVVTTSMWSPGVSILHLDPV